MRELLCSDCGNDANDGGTGTENGERVLLCGACCERRHIAWVAAAPTLSITEQAKIQFVRDFKPSVSEWVEDIGPALDKFADTILEDLRDRAINWAITVCDGDSEEGSRRKFIDCILTAEIAEWYQIQSGRTFYAYPDACGCRNPDCGGHQA